MTPKENLKNMALCPKFNDCNYPKCPLDFWAELRVELPEEKRCPNWKYVMRKTSKMEKGRVNHSLKNKILEIRRFKGGKEPKTT